MENKLEEKHNALVENLEKWSQSIVNLIKGNNSIPFTNVLGVRPRIVDPIAFPPLGAYAPRPPQGPISGNLAPIPRNNERGRSTSAKRRRGSNGSVFEEANGSARRNDKDQTNSNRSRHIVGTSNPTVAERKMRSPPVDIFCVWC